ncbi:MAG: thermonuclease family protein [bacterium]|nr:thermonuclease family protein [bacterium]
MKLLRTSPILLVIFSMIFLGEVSFAETYKWVDSKGVMHFSDRPQPTLSSLPIESPRADLPVLLPGKSVEKKELLPLKKDNPPERSNLSTKLYDLRGKVVETLGVDMIVLESGKRVKYIGVKDPSPFLSKNGLRGKIKDAHAYHQKLVRGKTVTVLLGETERDQDGSYLGHVFLGQQAFINAELIRNGYALTEDYPSDFEYQSLFVRLQNYAREKGLGIWEF